MAAPRDFRIWGFGLSSDFGVRISGFELFLRFGSAKRKISSVAVQNRTGTLGEAATFSFPASGSPASAMLATWPTTLPDSSARGAPLEPGGKLSGHIEKEDGPSKFTGALALGIQHVVRPAI